MKVLASIMLVVACFAFLCAWRGWTFGPFENLLPFGLFLWCLSSVLKSPPTWKSS